MADAANNTFQSLNPLERAKLFQRHREKDQLSQTQIAQKYGKSLPFVSNTLRLLQLPDLIKEGLMSKTISEGHARAILMLSSASEMVGVYRKILLKNISVHATEELVRQKKLKK
ncbi:MAG: hypothetical protein NUV98_03230 [Candidatus Roizmanbacteria bacterium]|nr:hypothetical protein [Candidatus Roizmanbacteria bacterium]